MTTHNGVHVWLVQTWATKWHHYYICHRYAAVFRKFL